MGLDSALEHFGFRVRAMFGRRVHTLLLFGSRARADAHDDSDVDVCVVIEDLEWREKARIYEAAAEVLDRYDFVLTPFILSSSRWKLLEERERRIVAEIVKDGVTL